MTDQTPSTGDVLTSDEMRRAFIAYREHVHAYMPDEAANEWDAWLAARDAARDREVAAKAWDEAHHAVYAFEGERYAWLNDAGPRPIVPMNPYRIGAGDE